MKNIAITRLVIGFSWTQRRLEQPAGAGFVNAVGSGVSPFLHAATKPKASPAGFFMGGRKTPQSGLAHGPTWAALKKHRAPRNGKLKRLGALQGACVVGRTAESTNEPSKAEVGWQGRASGISQPLKSSGFDKVFLVSGSLNNLEAGEGSANPCIRRPMNKKYIRQLQATAKKKSRAISLDGKSTNEVASLIRPAGDSFLASTEWRALRLKVIDAYGSRCMCCGAIPKTARDVNVDHIKPRLYFPELALAFDNLQVLCNGCNKFKGNKNQNDYRPMEQQKEGFAK